LGPQPVEARRIDFKSRQGPREARSANAALSTTCTRRCCTCSAWTTRSWRIGTAGAIIG